MAITRDNPQSQITTTNQTSYTLSYTVNSGSNRLLVVMAHIRIGATSDFTASATWDGNAMTESATATNTGTSRRWRTYIWYYIAPDVKTADIVVSTDGTTGTSWAMGAVTLRGAHQTTPLGIFGAGSTTGATVTYTLNSCTIDSQIIAAVTSDSAGPVSFAWTTATEDYDINNGDTTAEIGGSAAYYNVPSSGNVSFTSVKTGSGQGNVGCAAEFLAAASGTEYTKDVAGTVTSAGAAVKRTAKVPAGTVTSAGTVVRRAGKTLTGTVTSAGALVRQTGKALAGTLTSAGTVVRQTGKTLSGTVTSAGTLTKETVKALAGEVASTGAIARQTAKTLTGEVTSSGAVDMVRTFLVSLAGTLTSAGDLARQTGKSLAGAVTSAGDITRQTGKALAGEVTSSGTVTTLRAYFVALAGTLTSAGSLTRETAKSLVGAVTSGGVLSRSISKTFEGSVTSAGTPARQTGKAPAGALTSVGDVVASLISGGPVTGLIELTARARDFALTAKERVFSLTARGR